jgi:methylated-DNA-[protein]-cysteine S-methyltransferase
MGTAAVKRTVELLLSVLDSPIGEMLIVLDERERMRVLEWRDHEGRLHKHLHRHYGEAGSSYVLRRQKLPAGPCHLLNAYFAGEITALDTIPVHARGTEFQKEVWHALRDIPGGSTTSYGALAAKLKRPNAMRAVGLANGSNPVGLVVPCHRVIGADGSLTGYGGGLKRKQWLLEHERGEFQLVGHEPL